MAWRVGRGGFVARAGSVGFFRLGSEFPSKAFLGLIGFIGFRVWSELNYPSQTQDKEFLNPQMFCRVVDPPQGRDSALGDCVAS